MQETPFTVAHARRLRFVRDAGFCGPAGRVYYTVAAIDEDQRERNTLWVYDLDTSRSQRIATDLVDPSSPVPSPDGRVLAVVADTEARRQVFLAPVDGGPAKVLTELPQGVGTGLAWAPDGRSIAFTAGPREVRDPALPYWVDRMTYRHDGLGYLDDVVTDLYVVEVATGTVRQLTDDRCMNSQPRWSPDGASLAYLVSYHPDRVWNTLAELHVIDVDSGKSRVVVDSWGGVFSARWCADGDQLVFVGAPSAADQFSVHHGDVWTVSVDGGVPQCRTATVPTGVGLPVISNDLPVRDELRAPRLRVHGDVVYCHGQMGKDFVAYAVALSGPERVERALDGGGSVAFVDFSPEHGVLGFASSFTDPPKLVLATPHGTTGITTLNDELIGSVVRPRMHALRAVAADGLETEAWALTPPGDGPWPTVLYVHGGPWAAVGDVYAIDFHLMVAAGFAVVAHNFRGSGGYGREFAGKMLGDWGRNGSLDHHAAVDAAIAAGIADPERLGVYGISHGGFATCWLLGTSDRFKAGVSENAVTNFATIYGVGETEWWVAAEFGGTPQQVPDTYAERSPLTYAHNCTAPLLFIVGEDDLCCHPIESEQYYRVVRSNGVPTAMLRLPGADHVGSYSGPVPARTAQDEALIDWFRRYLLSAGERSQEDER